MDAARILSATRSLARTGLLTIGRNSDVKRWRDDNELSPRWFYRSIAAAKYIEPGSSVIEFGAGAGRLREVLPSDCRYQPADLVRRTPAYLEVDLNTDRPLPRGYDVAVMLGVVEYLHDPPRVLRRLRGVADRLVLSYCLPDPEVSRMKRRARGWVNDMTEARLVAVCNGGGFRVEQTEELEPAHNLRQVLLACRAEQSG